MKAHSSLRLEKHDGVAFWDGVIGSQSDDNAIEVHYWLQDFSSRIPWSRYRVWFALGPGFTVTLLCKRHGSPAGRHSGRDDSSVNKYFRFLGPDIPTPYRKERFAFLVIGNIQVISTKRCVLRRRLRSIEKKGLLHDIEITISHTACNAETPAGEKGSWSHQIRLFVRREWAFSLQDASSSTQNRAMKRRCNCAGKPRSNYSLRFQPSYQNGQSLNSTQTH